MRQIEVIDIWKQSDSFAYHFHVFVSKFEVGNIQYIFISFEFNDPQFRRIESPFLSIMEENSEWTILDLLEYILLLHSSEILVMVVIVLNNLFSHQILSLVVNWHFVLRLIQHLLDIFQIGSVLFDRWTEIT